jgi:hypothetical protein
MKAPWLKALHYGAICRVARVVCMVTNSRSKWFSQPSRGYVNYGWVLADVKRLRKPVECKGALQLWNVPPNILRSVKRQLPKRIAAKIDRVAANQS